MVNLNETSRQSSATAICQRITNDYGFGNEDLNPKKQILPKDYSVTVSSSTLASPLTDLTEATTSEETKSGLEESIENNSGSNLDKIQDPTSPPKTIKKNSRIFPTTPSRRSPPSKKNKTKISGQKDDQSSEDTDMLDHDDYQQRDSPGNSVSDKDRKDDDVVMKDLEKDENKEDEEGFRLVEKGSPSRQGNNLRSRNKIHSNNQYSALSMKERAGSNKKNE